MTGDALAGTVSGDCMRLGFVIAALGLLCGTPATAQPKDDLMDRLSVDQLMRISTLPPARLIEMRCAGYGQWLAANRRGGAKSPARPAADRLSADVQAAIANDAELPADLAGELLAAIAVEAGTKLSDEGEAAFAAEVEPCAPLYAAAASPEPLKLHPLASPSVVSPVLASCYGQYRLAASLSEGEEAGDLTANADRARELALKGKEGAARAAAEAALAAESHAAAEAPQADQEAGMMRLIMCQPMMAEAAKRNAQ